MHSNKKITEQIKGFLYCAIFAGCLAILTAPLNADAFTISTLNVENNEDYVVEPGKTEVFLNPGETVTKTISVTNRTNRPLDYMVGVENFIGSNTAETAVILLPAGSETPYPLSDYISTELDHFTLQFGERISFQITITVPEDIEPGGHYGAIIISNESAGQIDSAGNEVKSGTQLTSRIGSLILMRVNGPVKESGNLESFNVSGPDKWFYQKIPTAFEIAFKNEGNVHLVPYGTVTIKNIFGSEIAQLPVDAYFALPDSIRYQTISWPGKKFSFGLYTAELELYKGYGNQFDNEKIRFTVLPLMIIIPGILVFMIIFGVLYFISRRFEFKRK